MSRRWWRLVAALSSTALVGALMLAAAGPLDAGNSSTKTYTLGVSVGQNGPNSFSATFTNTTTNASINSVTLDQPAGFQFSSITSTSCSTTVGSTTIVSESVGLSNNCSVLLGTDPASLLPAIVVTNLNPLNYQETVTISWTFVVIPPNPTCNTSWTSNAWNGSNLSGTQFVSASATSGVAYNNLAGGGSTPTISSSTVAGVTVKNNSSSSASFGVVCGAYNQVSVSKPAGSTASLNLTADIKWNPETATYPLPPTKINGTNIVWCVIDPNTGAPTVPSGQVGCLISEDSNLVPSGQVQVEDWILLKFDPIISR